MCRHIHIYVHVEIILHHFIVSSRLYFTKLLKRSGACIDDMLHFFELLFICSFLQYACPVRHNSLLNKVTKLNVIKSVL
jgi:hypothetical protein